jgi:hypothetical protein
MGDRRIGPNRVGNIFEVLLTQVGKLNPDPAADIIVGRRRNADASGLCDALKPSRNIYAVAKNVVRFDDHVADVDADTKGNPSTFLIGGREFFDEGLEFSLACVASSSWCMSRE